MTDPGGGVPDPRVEAVAAAVWRENYAMGQGREQSFPYDRLIEPTKDDLRRIACAALAAADAVSGVGEDREDRLTREQLESSVRMRGQAVSGLQEKVRDLGVEHDRLREALEAELTHGGVCDQIAQIASIVGTRHFDHRDVGKRLDALRDVTDDRLRAALAGSVSDKDRP